LPLSLRLGGSLSSAKSLFAMFSYASLFWATIT
jgi:hypothetical protein